jgi:hypothetical protein
MTKPSTITQWLQHPGSFTEKDRQAVAQLVKSHPYFVPARYMEALETHKKQPYAPSMLTTMQLYRGNWIFFHEFMEGSGVSAPAVIVEEEEVIAEEENITEEEAIAEEVMDIDDAVDDENDMDDFNNWEDEDDDIITDIEDSFAEEPIKPFKQAPPPFKVEKPAPMKQEAKQAPEPAQRRQEPPKPAQEKPLEQPAARKEPVKPVPPVTPPPASKQQQKDSTLIQPIYTEDYFLHQGIQVEELKASEAERRKAKPAQEAKSLMVVMSFSEWLMHFKTKGEREREEVQDQKALKTMWQKEKLAAALEEENEEIPENVFEMAVNSITKEEDLASESLAEILVKQGKYDKAVDMYRKLSLRNPQKSAYFARKADEIIKDQGS